MMDKTTQIIDVLSMGYGTVPTSVMSDRKSDGRGEGDLCVLCRMHRGRGHKLPHGRRNQQGSQHVRGTIPEASETT